MHGGRTRSLDSDKRESQVVVSGVQQVGEPLIHSVDHIKTGKYDEHRGCLRRSEYRALFGGPVNVNCVPSCDPIRRHAAQHTLTPRANPIRFKQGTGDSQCPER